MDLTTIAIAQDNKTYTENLIYVLKSFEGVVITHLAKNGKDLLETLQSKIKPDIILMDIHMPLMDGFKTTTEVLKILPDCKILFLTSYDNESFVVKAIKSKAHGYLLKSADSNYLHDAIREVIEKGYYLNEYFTYFKLIEIFPDNENIKQLEPMKTDLEFTKTEMQVIRLLYEEKTDKEIAETLELKLSEIKKYRENLIQKVDAKSVEGIIIFAVKHHFV